MCPVRVWRWREDGGWWDELGTQEMSREDCSQYLGEGEEGGREEGREGGGEGGREERETAREQG